MKKFKPAGRGEAELESRVQLATRQLAPQLIALSRRIHDHPEPAFAEHQASAWLQEFLHSRDFVVETGLARLPTAFRAYSRRARAAPAVAFLAEMDALAGLGHACGHNLIAAGSAGAAAVLRQALPDAPGTVMVIGCPAEEFGGGKVKLAAAGVFDRLDAVLIVHPSILTEVFKLSLGLIEMELTFTGQAAHAAAEPHRGINALDAVIQTFNAVNAYRQQMPERARVHGVITEGGQAPNIIPARASARFLARGTTMAESREVARHVLAGARGAAQATGAKLRAKVFSREAYEPFVPNRALGRVFARALTRLGIPIEQGPEDKELGSTDVGNVSQRAPTLHPTLAIAGADAACHSPGFALAARSEAGMEMMLRAVQALALTGAEVLRNPELRLEVREEFKAQRRAQP
jgi:amidohydrolase